MAANECPRERAQNSKPLLDNNGACAEWVAYIMYGAHSRKWNAQVDKLTLAFCEQTP